ncbi:MAG: acylphosphatase [Weizmannia coagulans]|jgi:acylphosphatase|uniref:acylphosphatase n=1 Tax=Heyndrickxia TaxID=2837504 RepID=UPI000779352B|nr:MULTISPECIES: acylphosphatase [Heyndrickxia]AVD56487.1 acylphosphatase [Heyndrickxia coagulans]KYC61894.1 putative Acylphosphate phosphohydrolase [Heyndrickxia coagulans]MBQ4910301.1 acylphosphatase [Heyndrickxia faecalis]MCI1574359.1 acylphosphatase [Heyndrickxia coagulans]MEC2304205.1 acylphosphatase [Weizmannia sp. CD-2023]
MEQQETLHIIVSGRVQGVGFRYHTQFLAKQYNICGWVRNKDDGTVEVMAQGEKKEMEQFIRGLKKGPSRFAKVTGMDIDYLQQQEQYRDFRVLY